METIRTTPRSQELVQQAPMQTPVRADDATSACCWSWDEQNGEITVYHDHDTNAYYVLNAHETRVGYSTDSNALYNPSSCLDTYQGTVSPEEHTLQLERAKRLRSRDQAVHLARARLAHEMTGEGGPLLERILLTSIERGEGVIGKPYKTRQGVDIYAVGENASHTFYAGTKDGRVYRYADCPSDLVLFEDRLNPYDESSPDEHTERLVWMVRNFLWDEWRTFDEGFDQFTTRFDQRWESLEPSIRQQLQQAIELYKDQPYDPKNHSFDLNLPPDTTHEDTTPLRIAIRNSLHDVTEHGSLYMGRGATLVFNDLLPTTP